MSRLEFRAVFFMYPSELPAYIAFAKLQRSKAGRQAIEILLIYELYHRLASGIKIIYEIRIFYVLLGKQPLPGDVADNADKRRAKLIQRSHQEKVNNNFKVLKKLTYRIPC